MNYFNRLGLLFIFAAVSAATLSADVVETRNGARLVGTVTSIDGTTVKLETDYAGTLSIKQEEVVSIATDNPQFYRLSGGTVLQGRLATTPAGELQIVGSEGTMTTRVGNVAASWSPGDEDPAVASLRRRWSYEVGVDVTGKRGNSSQMGTALHGRAVLRTPEDTLEFYTAYMRQKADGVKSADQLKLGIDYQNNFAGRTSWYTRTEGGFDRIKGIRLYNVSAAGLGYDVIKEPSQTLTLRGGLSYRYEGYDDPLAEDVSSAGLDLALRHELLREWWSMSNVISYVPAFDDFGNFRVIHDSGFEMPVAASRWKLRIGLMNDYTSEPPAGREKLDTTYYTRLILNWQ
jgi:putative salt-induced outer membrane protein YdiY